MHKKERIFVKRAKTTANGRGNLSKNDFSEFAEKRHAVTDRKKTKAKEKIP
ncbi:hypothetical protein [Intestinibacillus sp. Marseille-P6563]|uniref:hypothetical protein n=1 Tax=Intestinibacillus sp. Marseille-P6563 TaxID=2364792 RepID=UPI0013E0623B|nr:hypothetical protein [Intestinibacillus sp. Marseille-P6563]